MSFAPGPAFTYEQRLALPNSLLHIPMTPVLTTSHDFLVMLTELSASIVITKNLQDGPKQNFRPAPDIRGRWLDGLWPGVPKRVTPNEGFGIHFVERDRVVFIGEYQGTQPEVGGKYSIVLDNVQAFEITDFDQGDISQQRLRAILKQPGAVTYSYYDADHPLGDLGTPGLCYTIAEVKIRLQQKAFRRAVFQLRGERCVITGCAVGALLEAAHLPGRAWKLGHNKAQDGIPLRIDLHRALDANLLRLDEEHRMEYLHPSLQDAYGQYLR